MRMRHFVTGAVGIAVSCGLAIAAEPKDDPALDKLVVTILESHDPLHLDQIHSLTEALSDRKQQPKVEDVCESLQRLVMSEKVVISTAENNPKWRPLTLVMWDDAKHLKKEPEGKTR